FFINASPKLSGPNTRRNFLIVIFPIGLLLTNLNLMAFNLATFKTRSLTAIVFALVMVAGLFFNRWSFVILFTIIHFGCWYEFILLLKKINNNYRYFLPAGLIY